ncbi:hypothetical protein ACFYU8_18660 [Brevibacillus sp. NPDC003359]|uniref:hypothetical protein n=1 Tax=unclassified Brevibacillus TaxID=2684853 RepID=UPI0036802D09
MAALTRKKIINALEKLERRNNTLDREQFTEHVSAIYHGGLWMWWISDERNHRFSKLFHTFQIEQAVDCILERVAITEEQMTLDI